jgi:hypothetical protein
MSRRTGLWLIWLFVAFGALNASWREEGDISVYFAYAEATLGRPYAADLVVPLDEARHKRDVDLNHVATPPRPLVPWRDFLVEYPPGMMIPALAPALVTKDMVTYDWLFTVEMEIALTLAVWLAVRVADRLKADTGSDALAHAIILTRALGGLAVRRYDPCVALAIAAAVHTLARGRPALSGAALGFATVLKGVPILLAPIFAMYALSRGDRRGVARGAVGCALTCGAFGVAYSLIAGPHVWDAFAYHGVRPLEIQTIYAGLVILGRMLEPGFLSTTFSYGSNNVVSVAEPALRTLSTVLTILSVLTSWVYAYRRLVAARDDADRLLAVVVASLACLIALHHTQQGFQPVILRLAHPPGDAGRAVDLAQLAVVAAPRVPADPDRISASVSIPLFEAQCHDERPDLSQDALSLALRLRIAEVSRGAWQCPIRPGTGGPVSPRSLMAGAHGIHGETHAGWST